jgi:hypothetical protein
LKVSYEFFKRFLRFVTVKKQAAIRGTLQTRTMIHSRTFCIVFVLWYVHPISITWGLTGAGQWVELMEAVTSKYPANSLDVYVAVFF